MMGEVAANDGELAMKATNVSAVIVFPMVMRRTFFPLAGQRMVCSR